MALVTAIYAADCLLLWARRSLLSFPNDENNQLKQQSKR